MNTVVRFLVLVLVFLPALAWAGDASKGEEKSILCVSCHGKDGISVGPLWPNLAGQKDGYLIKQMKAFRSGKRMDMMMVPLMQNLSDADISNLATFYSQLGAVKASAKE